MLCPGTSILLLVPLVRDLQAGVCYTGSPAAVAWYRDLAGVGWLMVSQLGW